MLKKKLNQLLEEVKEEIGLLLSISFGIFLFVLFFQPFTFTRFDFNNSLIFVAGLGLIEFILMAVIRVIVPGVIDWNQKKKNDQENKMLLLPAYFNGFIILVFSTLSFVFYLRYVGGVSINFFLVIRIILICLVPPFILGIYDFVEELKQQNDMLVIEKKRIQKQIEKYEEDLLNKSIEFISENNSENFSLLISEVVFIRSADNYVEIIYKERDNFKKKLIRNTLRNIELQIKQYTNFIRCHRICIVNLHYVDKIIRNNANNWLVIKGYDEQLPVSRQYLLKLKEAI
jgi:hypothetical protein